MTRAWVICTDLAGLVAQGMGLAEAAGLEVELHTLRVRKPWSYISSGLWPAPLRAVEPDAITPPLPEVIIGCGGVGARIAAALRRPGIRAVAIQHPRMSLKKFDLVFVARHDGIAGPNVVSTRNALHRVTASRLAMEGETWRTEFCTSKRPMAAVLLGGSNGRYRMDESFASRLAAQLGALMQNSGMRVVITPSRRTAPQVMAILRAALAPLGAWIWNGEGKNPYFGMLALADIVLVSADSVSMVSEAIATSKPVYLLRLPGKSSRIGAFMDMLVEDGRVRDFSGGLEAWDCAPLDDTPMAGKRLAGLLKV